MRTSVDSAHQLSIGELVNRLTVVRVGKYSQNAVLLLITPTNEMAKWRNGDDECCYC